MALSPNMNVMLRAIEKAGRSLVRDFGEVEQLQVSRKGPGDFVSAADRRAEDIIFDELSKSRPDFGFLMEESGADKGPKEYEYRFIIDPLDGTTNFLHGIPHWCVSIGLEHKGEIIAGVVFNPVTDETFRAEKGMGAFMRNTRLRTSSHRSFESAVISVDAPPFNTKETKDVFMTEFAALLSTGAAVRRYGAAALDLAYVAVGRFDALRVRNAKPWDIAAGSIIIKEAGGMISDLKDKGNPVHTGNVIASNTHLHTDLKRILQGANKGQKAA